MSESTWQLDLGRGHTEHGGEVVLYPVSLCKVRRARILRVDMIVSDLDSVDGNTPPPLQRELRLGVGHCQETWLYAITYEIILTFVE